MAEPKNRRFIVIDVNKLEVREEMSGDEKFLDFAYRNIGCSCVDVQRLAKKLDVWCDDEGLLKSPTRFVAWADGIGIKQLAGTVIIAEHDNEGETIGATMSLETAKRLFFIVVKLTP